MRKNKKRNHQKHPVPNHKYKDRLFRLVFNNKRDLLDLYNALNNTCYENPNDLEVNTLEDAVYLSMKNDISFLIGGTLNLYEHQSTYNPNMPLRGLIYLARLYDGYVETENINLYSSTLKKLPIPQYFVFYNGTKEQPDETILRLTDAFESVSDNRQPCLQCTAVMLNINYGHNLALMEKCQRLKEYSIFVDTVRIQCKKTSDPRHAVTKAVDICIEKGILRDVLVKHKAEVHMKFSSTLKELREQNHVTQNQLASHLKLTRSTIAGYETKGKQPDYERLLQIADYFHVSVDYLLTGSETNGISVPPDSSEYRLLCAYLNLSSDSRQQLFEYTEFLQDQDTKKGRMPK